MAGLDILLLIPVIIGAVNGYKRGILVEIIGILALFIAIIFGFRYLGLGMDLIARHTGLNFSGRLLPYLSFLLIFFPSIFFINKLGWLFRKALRLTFLGLLDGIGGTVFGALLWFFGMSVVLWLAGTVNINLPQEWVAESKMYPYYQEFAPQMISKLREILPSAGAILDKLKNIEKSYGV